MLVLAGIIGFSACKHTPLQAPSSNPKVTGSNNNGNPDTTGTGTGTGTGTDTTGTTTGTDTTGTGTGTDTTGTGTGTDTTSYVSCDPDTVYFVQDVLPIFQGNCATSGCHGGSYGQAGIRLDTYTHIITTGHIHAGSPNSSLAYEYMVTNGGNRMPPWPAAHLPSATTNLVYTWIMQGALNNSCDASGGCDTNNVTFSGNILPIMQASCISCHSSSNPQGGLQLSNYAEISTQALNGSLLQSVNGSSNFVQMPYQAAALPQCKIDQIRIWIQDGAPNN